MKDLTLAFTIIIKGCIASKMTPEQMASQLNEHAQQQVKNLNISAVKNWVAISNQLPPKNIYVWLCNVDENITGHEYVVKYDLTTQHFQRKWTHWAVAKPPCL